MQSLPVAKLLSEDGLLLEVGMKQALKQLSSGNPWAVSKRRNVAGSSAHAETLAAFTVANEVVLRVA